MYAARYPRLTRMWLFSICVLFVGCEPPTDGAPGTAARWLQAQASRDANTLWELLAPEHQAQVTTLHRSLIALDDLVKGAYPASMHETARTAAGTTLLDDTKDAAELFALLVTRSSEGVILSTFQKVGLRPGGQQSDDAGTLIKTMGGDDVTVVEVDGGLRVRLSDEDALRLGTMLTAVTQTQTSLQRQLEARKSKRL